MNTTPTCDNCNISSTEKQNKWFQDYIRDIHFDQLKYQANILDTFTKDFYTAAIEDDEDKLVKMTNDVLHKRLSFRIIREYLIDLINKDVDFVNLAFDLTYTGLLVWAVIEDDDEETEGKLYLVEAKINAEYSDFNYHISTTVVEKSDQVSIPNHYQVLPKGNG